MAMDIEPVLAAFDGRHVAPLRALADRPFDDCARSMLLGAIPGPYAVAATWIVKARAERTAMARADLERVFNSLPDLTQPDAILHVLQTVRFHPDAATPLLPEFMRLAGHPKVLIRVWAFDAYCRATTAQDRDPRIVQGLTHRSKVMRARARGLAREFGVPLPPET